MDPTPQELAKRVALVRQSRLDDRGQIIPAGERVLPDLGNKCSRCGNPIPVSRVSSTCGRCGRPKQKTLTERIYEWLIANGPASVSEISRQLNSDRCQTGQRLRAKRDVLFRQLVGLRTKSIWEAIQK